MCKRVLEFLNYESKSRFRISFVWTCNFMKRNLNWNFRKAIRSTQKLPSNWKLQGLLMAQRAAYLVKTHSTSLEMMVNIDQARIHLMPIGGLRTWAEKGSKHILIHSMEDKWQITISVSCLVAGNLLSFELIFSRIIAKCLLPSNDRR